MSTTERDERHRWSMVDRISLRARLVAILALLLAAGLGIATLTTTTIVSNYLVGQLDDQLRRSVPSLDNGQLVGSTPASGTPSDYFVFVRFPDGSTATREWPATTTKFGRPKLPEPSFDADDPEVSEPFTVNSTGSGQRGQWRVISFNFPVGTAANPLADATQHGVAYIARPLGDIQETVRFLALTLCLSAVGIVLLGAVAAHGLVRRTLRPLRQIETTAAAIAAGDLTRRVPPAAPTTEVGSLSASLNAMLGQIERAFATREASETRMRQFVSDASHELRTPLATIRGYGELYRMGALDTSDKVDDTMGRIEDAASRMGTLVSDLLALARLDEGRPLRHEPVDLVALALDSAQDLHALDPTRQVQVTGLKGGEPPTDLVVTGDEERLRQVLANLIGNVARHTPTGTEVQLALGRDDDFAVLEVRDHGPGISEEQVTRIFERFYRADSSRNRSSGGSGLGMAIVAAIVGAHDGTAMVQETEGGGLTVVVRLPAHRTSPPPR